jgi:tetratricopeptide (TPR) repeat protein
MKDINKLLKEAIFQFSRKNLNDSRKMFNKVLDHDAANPEANYYLGLIYSKEENFQKAVLHLKAVVDLGANFLFTQQCRMILGYIYFKNKEFERAEYEFLEVLNSKINLIQVYAALAAVYYYLPNPDKSMQFAEKAYNMDQFNLNAKNTYGYILCDYGIDITKGLEMLREVIRIKPDNPAYLDSLGWAYYKKGDLKAAIRSLRKAIDLAKGLQKFRNIMILL